MIDLVCPDCGGKKFSWKATVIQFGSVLEFDGDSRIGEAWENGEVVNATDHDEGVFCVNCEEMYDIEALVPPGDGEQ